MSPVINYIEIIAEQSIKKILTINANDTSQIIKSS